MAHASAPAPAGLDGWLPSIRSCKKLAMPAFCRPIAERGTLSPSGILFKSRPLVVFGLCVMLFHLANAALLPLVGQKLAAAYPEVATAMMSACIVAAQAVMLPIALLVGRTADSWGRKPLFLAGFAILPIRAVLYTRQQRLADRCRQIGPRSSHL
jgi:hypothetical protein